MTTTIALFHIYLSRSLKTIWRKASFKLGSEYGTNANNMYFNAESDICPYLYDNSFDPIGSKVKVTGCRLLIAVMLSVTGNF